MFDIGFWEILLILVLALLVLGPERLPQAARSVGYWVGKGRRYVEGVKNQVETEFDSSELKRILRNQEVQIKELQNKIVDTEHTIGEAYNSELEDDESSEALPERQYEIIEDDDEFDEEDEEVKVSEQKAKTATEKMNE